MQCFFNEYNLISDVLVYIFVPYKPNFIKPKMRLYKYILLLFLLHYTSSIWSETHTVSNVTELYSAWQSLDDGDVLEIKQGTYNMTSYLYKKGLTDITVIGEGDNTIIDFSSALYYGFGLKGMEINFRDLTIQNANVRGAIYAFGYSETSDEPPFETTTNYSVVNLENVNIKNCSGTNGAVHCGNYVSSVSVTKCKFFANTSPALQVNDVRDFTFENNEVYGNSGGYAVTLTAASSTYQGVFRFRNNTIVCNTGGGCFFDGLFGGYNKTSNGLIDNNVFADNGTDVLSGGEVEGYNNVIETIGSNFSFSSESTNNDCGLSGTFYSVSGTTLTPTSVGSRYIVGKVLRNTSSCPSTDINGKTRNSIITDAGAEELDLNDYPASVWIGGSSTDWSTAANWRNEASAPDNSTYKIVIPPSTLISNDPIVGAAVSASNAELYLYPQAIFRNKGTITVDDITVKSSSSGTGQFSNEGTIAVYGDEKWEQYLIAGQWNFLCIPENITADNLFPDLNFGGTDYNYGDYWIAYYDGAKRAESGTSGDNWVDISSGSTVLEANKGYIVWVDKAQIVEFGKLPLSDVTTSLVSHSGSASESNWGWNLIGNPFSIALSSQSISEGNSTAVYVNNGSDYDTWVNGAGSVSAIPAHQAYFVQADVSGGANSFVQGYGDAVYDCSIAFKSASVSDRKLLTVNVSDKLGDNDQTFLRLQDVCSDNFDSSWDSYKWAGRSSSFLGVRSVLENIDYDVNSFNVLNGVKIIPLFLTMSDKLKEMTMSFSLEGLDDVDVYLLNANSGTSTKLTDGYELSLNIDDASTIKDNFSIKIVTGTSTGITENTLDGIRVYSVAGKVKIENDDVSEPLVVMVYDLLGKKTAQCNIEGEKGYIGNLSSGLHIVKVKKNGIDHCYKVIVQ